MITNPDQLRKILETINTIAVVGASDDPQKPAHTIPAYLASVSYKVIPVNPNRSKVLGRKSYPKLTDIPESVDVVDVFRPSEETPMIAEQAVEIGAKVLWLQQGISNPEAARIATAGGLKVVMDLCMGTTHRFLIA